jgi:uncharacterized membrane protein YbhN (UPF0104 family)
MNIKRLNIRSLLSFLVPISFVAILVTKVDFGVLAGTIQEIKIGWVLCAGITFIFLHLFQCFRWFVCAKDVQINVRYPFLLVSYLSSLPVGVIFPTEYGGDVLRVIDLSRIGDKAKSIFSLFMVRIFGLAPIFLWVTLYSYRSDEYVENINIPLDFRYMVMLSIFIFVAPILLKGLAIKKNMILSCNIYYKSLALGIIAQLFMIAVNYAQVCSLNLPVDLMSIVLFIPVLSLSSLVPVPAGGLGVREYIFVYYFGCLGVSVESALALSILNRSFQWFISFVGALVFPMREKLLLEYEK